jgi:hypothetical protein
MTPEGATAVFRGALRQLVIDPRYSGRIELRVTMDCYEGGIRACSIGMDKTVTEKEVKLALAEA